jgi:hypothetical protein
MDNRRKKAFEEMKGLPSNNAGRKVRYNYLVHVFDKDMHHDFISMSESDPLDNECYMDQDSKGSTWYYLVAKPIVQEATKVFKSAMPKLCGTPRREDDMDAEASPAIGNLAIANNELIVDACPLASSLQTIHVGQQMMPFEQKRNMQFLQTVAAQ